jgi:outer membrane protein assembly factor BamA
VLGQVSYPFDRFRRVDFTLDLQTVNNKTANVLFSTGEQVAAAHSRVYYVIPGISYVKDTSAYSGFTPVAGGRFRIGMEQAVGNIGYSFGVLDWRRYLNYRTRNALALRLVAAGSAGPDKQRLRIGGPDTFRGADFGALLGSRAVLGNAELRFPIVPTTELLRGVVFVDAASAWWQGENPILTTRGGPLGFTLRDLQLAYGFGFRAFVGLPLRIDFAIPTNLAVSGDMRTVFAIGWDF